MNNKKLGKKIDKAKRESRNDRFFDITLISMICMAAIFRIINVFTKRLYYDEWGALVGMQGHPPFSYWLHQLIMYFYGVNIPLLRFATLIISTLNFIIIFYIAKKMYDRKIAKYSLFIITISFWALFFSTNLDHEGSEVLFSSLLLFISWLRYKESNFSSKQGYIFAIMLAVALFSKTTQAMFYLIFLIDYLITIHYKNKIIFSMDQIKYHIKKIVLPYLLSLILIIIMYAALFFLFPSRIDRMFSHNLQRATLTFINPLPIFYFMMYATPLLILLILFAIKKIDFKKDYTLIIPVVVSAIFFSLVKEKYLSDFDRYLITFMFMPLVLLTAKTTYSFFIKNIRKIALLTFIFLSTFFLIITLYQPSQIAHTPLSFLSTAMMQDFLFPITSNTGPFVQLPIWLFLGTCILSAILLMASFMTKKRRNIIGIMLFSLLISYNLLLVGQYVFRISYVDYDASVNQAIDYIKNTNTTDYYITNSAMFYYISSTLEDKTLMELSSLYYNYDKNKGTYYEPAIGKNITMISEGYTSAQNEKKIQGYTYMLFQNLKFGKEQINKIEETCSIKKIFYTNNYESLRIYSC